MRSALFVAAALAALAGCKGEPFRPDAAPPIDAPPKPAWFQPSAGEAKNWDIQLAAYDFMSDRDMVIVNLWDVVPAPLTITYADGSTLDILAGSQATAIASLKNRGTKVMCHVGVGAIQLTDPDAMKFVGYDPAPPNRPAPIAAGSTIGWSVPGHDAERFIDYRNTNVQAVLLKRVQLAKDIGCEGIAAYRTDVSAFAADSGFTTPVKAEEDLAWIKTVAARGHELTFSVGGRGVSMPNLSQVTLDYDWLVSERCAEASVCDFTKPFVNANRSVFGIDYPLAETGTPNSIDTICATWRDDQVDGIVKTPALDGSARTPCE